MVFQKLIKSTLIISLSLVAAACTAPPPYVKNVGEFDRTSSVFLNGITDREKITICYAKNGTTPAMVSALAQQECASYAKRAVFREQSLQVCPLLTPVAAIYDCVESTAN